MKIGYHKRFLKNYKVRILPNKSLDKRYEERMALFIKNPQSSILEDHPLKGEWKGFRAFSITGDIRVIYQIDQGVVLLYDVGTHNQLY